MKHLLKGAGLVVACAFVAACSGGSTILTPQKPAPAPPGTGAPGPTQPQATTITASVSLNNGAALTNAPLTMPVPAPSGYAQTITASLVNAAAGTTVAVTAGPSPAPAIAPLGTSRALLAVRRPLASSGQFNTIFYDSIVPSANITVAGKISFTQSFPGGGLSAGTQYYLAFYDTTQASPAWQTIAGPVTASGANLTFSGTISSLTLVANKQYGFAIFSGASPTTAPPPAPQTLVYFGNHSTLTIATESGTVVNTLNIPSTSFDLDDAGNVYAANYAASNLNGKPPVFAKYPAGSATPAVTYQPTVNNPQNPVYVLVSGAGEVAAVHYSASGLKTDVWDIGQSGAPSRTLTTIVANNAGFVMTHDGTLYLPDQSASGVPQYDVFPPGASSPSKTIPETIVPASQYANFSTNYAAVGADGTLYVTEYTFSQPDPNAGLYIYPLNGPERFVATPSNGNGPGPEGVDVDGSGNIYVVNNNSGVTSPTTCQGDSLQSVTVYSGAGQLERTVTASVPTSAYAITVAADGTAFYTSFPVQFQQACPVSGELGIFSIAPGASTATQISTSGSTQIVLFDGTHKTIPFSVRTMSAGGAHAGGAHSSGNGGFLTRHGTRP